MNRKQIIQIIVVIAAFAGSGIILYNGLFKKSSGPSVPSLMGATPGAVLNNGEEVNIDKLLPYGDSLDFSKVVRKDIFQYRVLTPTLLNPNTEVGVLPQQLIKSLPSTIEN